MGVPIRIKGYRFSENLEEPTRMCHLCAQYEDDQPTADEEVDLTIEGGRLHPESDMVEYEGRWYCTEHFNFKFNRKLREENVVEYEEIDPYPEVE